MIAGKVFLSVVIAFKVFFLGIGSFVRLVLVFVVPSVLSLGLFSACGLVVSGFCILTLVLLSLVAGLLTLGFSISGFS